MIIPDVRVMSHENWPLEPWTPAPGGNALAVAEPVEITTLIEDEMREMRVEIIDAALKQVVTVIEVLSPTNKTPGARGQESYRRKRREVLASTSHWVEIDLLRAGQRLVTGELLPYGDYFIHVSRVERRPAGQALPLRSIDPSSLR